MNKHTGVAEPATRRVAVSAETRTWAAKMLQQYRAVEALHAPVPRWQLVGYEDGGSWAEKDDALEALHEGTYDTEAQPDAGDEGLCFFLVCAECSRIERDFAQQQFPDAIEWGYQESVWPCATARAMGHDKETA